MNMSMSIHHSASQMQHSDQIRRLIQMVKDLTKWTTRMPDLLEMSLRGQGVAASEANQMGMCVSAYANEYVAAWTWWMLLRPLLAQPNSLCSWTLSQPRHFLFC